MATAALVGAMSHAEIREPGRQIDRSDFPLHLRDSGAWRLVPKPREALKISVVGENYRVRGLLQAAGEPAVVWLPQLEGSDEASELVLRLSAARGMASLALLPPRKLDLGDHSRRSWEQVADERVRAGRAALRILDHEARPRCMAVAGLSLGGHAAIAVAQLEDGADVIVTMLAGSGAEMASAVNRLSGRDGTSLPSIGTGLLDLPRGSMRLSRERTLVVRALYDELIPPRATDALVRALGRPTEHAYPSGHASFRAFLPLAVWRALGFIERACAGAA
jgi:hypothetical protein